MNRQDIIEATRAMVFINHEDRNEYEFITMFDLRSMHKDFPDSEHMPYEDKVALMTKVLTRTLGYSGACDIRHLSEYDTRGLIHQDTKRFSRNVLFVSVYFSCPTDFNRFKICEYELYNHWKGTSWFLIEDDD